MSLQSAGLLLYRRSAGEVQVLLVHPGGPYWASRDEGAWSIPKGEFDGDAEEAVDAARREFEEETGHPAPEGPLLGLGTATQRAGKVVHGFAAEGDLDPGSLSSNTFTMEWPPRSGTTASFPEVDRAEWLALPEARRRINPGQVPLLDRLVELLDSI